MKDIKASLYRTSRKGFRAKITRWQPTGELGGFFIRAFGRVFTVYGTDI